MGWTHKEVFHKSFIFYYWFFNTTSVKKVSEYYRNTGEPVLSISQDGSWKKVGENFVEFVFSF